MIYRRRGKSLKHVVLWYDNMGLRENCLKNKIFHIIINIQFILYQFSIFSQLSSVINKKHLQQCIINIFDNKAPVTLQGVTQGVEHYFMEQIYSVGPSIIISQVDALYMYHGISYKLLYALIFHFESVRLYLFRLLL